MKKLDITTMPDYRKVEAVVQLLVNGTLTSYRIATDANISKMSILTLTKGTSKIKNITYQTAMALINWYEENHEKYGITIHQKAAGQSKTMMQLKPNPANHLDSWVFLCPLAIAGSQSQAELRGIDAV